jgi:hypothetical protein
MKSICTILALLLASSASAAIVTADQAVPELTKEKPDHAISSSELRLKRKLSVMGGLGMQYSLRSVSVDFDYNLSDRDTVNVSLATNESDNNSENDNKIEDVTALKVSYKRFVGNNLYLSSGLFYRNFEVDVPNEGRNVFEIGETNFAYKDVGLGLAVGHQWQWDRFTIGCDWLGLNASLIKLDEEISSANPNFAKPDERKFSANLLHFYVGASF